MEDKVQQLEKDILRKIRQRNRAIKDLGIQCDYSEEPTEENLTCKINKECDDARLYSLQTGYWNLDAEGKKTVFSSVKTFIKKAERKIIGKLLGWYIFPIYEKQSTYNGKVVNALELLKDYTDSNHSYIEKLTEQINIYESNIAELNMKLDDMNKKTEFLMKNMGYGCDINLLDGSMDYFKFENTMRGPESTVKEIQKDLLPYFKESSGLVVDIGCGRGEFLELLQSNNIPYVGIDNYEPFITYCKNKKLNVINGDLISILNNMEDNNLGGIIMSHVIEHLNNDYLLTFLKLAYRKLQKNSYLVIQTPNCQALLTYIDFYKDIGHVKPVHYSTIEFLLKENGFSEIIRYNPEQTKFGNIVTGIDTSAVHNKDEFNYGMGNLNQYLSGYQDYVIIARK